MGPMMSPGSYQQYSMAGPKADTTIFASWLLQNAMACGYLPPGVSEMTKKQRAAASQETSRPVAVSDLLIQAEVIAKSRRSHQNGPDLPSPFALPLNVERAALRAIDARRSFNHHFHKLGVTPASDVAHKFFINTMQQALDTIRRPKSESIFESVGTETNKDIINRFQRLTVDDTEDLHHTEPTRSSKKAKWLAKMKAVEAQVQEHEDAMIRLQIERQLMVYHFYIDMETIRGFVVETWTQYYAHELDLRTATIVTDAAIALVEHAEKELHEKCQMQSDNLPLELMALIEPVLALLPIRDNDLYGTVLHPDLMTSNIGKFLDLSTFQTLRTLAASVCNPLTKQHGPDVTCSLRSLLADDFHDRMEESAMQTLLSENESLTYLMMEIFVHNKHINEPSQQFFPRFKHLDQMSTVLLHVKDMKITACMTFAGRIAIDVRACAMDYPTRPYLEVVNAGSSIIDTFGDPYTTKHKPRHYKICPSKDEKKRGTICLVPYLTCFAHFLTQYKSMRLHMPEPNMQDGFDAEGIIYAGNHAELAELSAVHCGSLLLNTSLLREEAGVKFANGCGSVICCAYLYSALQRRNMLKLPWPELDAFIALHMGSVFFGSVPRDPPEFYRRLILRAGSSVSSFGAGARVVEIDWARERVLKNLSASAASRKKLACLTVTELSECLSKYFRGDESMLRTTHSIDAFIQKRQQHLFKEHNSEAIPVVAMLQRLRTNLPELLRPVDMDYMALTDDCNGLLDSILDSKQIKVTATFVPDWFNLVMQIIALDSDKYEDEIAQGVPRDILHYDQWDLDVAGEFVRGFLEGRMNSEPKTDRPSSNDILAAAERT